MHLFPAPFVIHLLCPGAVGLVGCVSWAGEAVDECEGVTKGVRRERA